MKSPQKVKRIKLTVNDQEEPVVVLLVTPDPDYKLTLKINSALNIALKGSDPVHLSGPGKPELVFSRFTDNKGSPELIFHLISNKSENNCLLKKFKNIDYIFVLHDLEKSMNLNKISGKLRKIDSVTAVFNVDAKTLKDKDLTNIIYY